MSQHLDTCLKTMWMCLKLIKFHITVPHIVFPVRTDQWLNIAVHQDVQHTCQVCHQMSHMSHMSLSHVSGLSSERPVEG